MIIFESAKVTLVAVGVRDGARSGGGGVCTRVAEQTLGATPDRGDDT